MNAQQIAKFLSDKGFVTSLDNHVVTVSLNRAISIMEVEIALDFEVESCHIWKSGKVVKVLGL